MPSRKATILWHLWPPEWMDWSLLDRPNSTSSSWWWGISPSICAFWRSSRISSRTTVVPALCQRHHRRDLILCSPLCRWLPNLQRDQPPGGQCQTAEGPRQPGEVERYLADVLQHFEVLLHDDIPHRKKCPHHWLLHGWHLPRSQNRQPLSWCSDWKQAELIPTRQHNWCQGVMADRLFVV